MKKTNVVLGCMLILVLAMSTSLMAVGTEPTGNPREVSLLEHLLWISTNSSCWGDDFTQMNDIDASATSTWNPTVSSGTWVSGTTYSIGDIVDNGTDNYISLQDDNTGNIPSTSPDYWAICNYQGFSPIGKIASEFTGSYDGGNHIIDNLYINRPSEFHISLFGYTNGAEISNIGVTNVNINGSRLSVGGLVGCNDSSTINNCYSTGSVSVSGIGGNPHYRFVGGLVGYNHQSTISNSYSSVSVTGSEDDYIGGLVGTNSQSTINNSYSTGSADGVNRVGGLVGFNGNYSTISNSYSTGSVEGVDRVGGLVGYNYNFSIISNSYSKGSVTGDGYVGGFVGWNVLHATIRNCYGNGDVTRNDGTSARLGGFCGYNNDSTIEYCYSTGSVFYTGADDPNDKGFVGYNESGTHTNNFWDSEASNQSTGPETYATRKNTTQMKTQGTFTAASWDFETIWEIADDSYPNLIDNPDTALPITLSSFTGCMEGTTPQLAWTTQSETDNAGWNVYRAAYDFFDQSTLLTTDLLTGAGTSSQATDYTYLDVEELVSGTKYFYWLESISLCGQSETWGPVTINIPTIDPGQTNPYTPKQLGLMQNYPNPFNPTTEICFALPTAEKVNLDIFNAKGQCVRNLLTATPMIGKEVHRIQWNGTDNHGNEAASGLYFYRIQAGDINQQRKMILLK